MHCIGQNKYSDPASLNLASHLIIFTYKKDILQLITQNKYNNCMHYFVSRR